ncbi:MAG: Gfo/Idh/MocA family oxidoreductase [Rhizobiaceae bacterium]
MSHFAAVIRQEEQPLISGEEGLENLRVMEAMLKSANIGQPLTL